MNAQNNSAKRAEMERLNKAMKELYGIASPTEIARKLGFATSQILKNWETRGISDKGALQIQTATGISAEWLKTGAGDMLTKDALIPPAGGIAELETTDTRHTHREIQMYDLQLSAGAGNAVWVIRQADDPLVFRAAWFAARRLSPDNLRGMRVKGNSMIPILQDMDTVLIDISDTELIDGAIYALCYKEKFYIKSIKHIEDGIELISHNPEHQTITVRTQDADKFQCLGRMVWRGG